MGSGLEAAGAVPSLSAGATGAGVRMENGQPLVSMNSLSLTSMFTAWCVDRGWG